MPINAHCSIVCCPYFESYTPKKPLHPFTCGITCILLHALPSAEVVAFVYMHTLAYLLHALPLEEALASVHVRSIRLFFLSGVTVLLSPCICSCAQTATPNSVCRATLTARRMPSYVHCSIVWGDPGATSGPSWGLLGASCGPLCSVCRATLTARRMPSYVDPGAISGPSWDLLEVS